VKITPDAGAPFTPRASSTPSTDPVTLTTFGDPGTNNPLNGTVGGQWSFETLGQKTLTASGIGYAAPPVTGAGSPDGVQPVNPSPFVLEFRADVVCDNGTVNVEPDGSISAGEYAHSQGFMANLSGGSTAPATFYFMNDCTHAYFGVSVERDIEDKVNILRIDIDNDNDREPDPGDDVLVLEGVTGLDDVLTDAFLTPDCLKGGKQAACGSDDEDDEGSADVAGDWEYRSGLSVYELAQPLMSGDTGHDIDLDFGESFGLFVTLRMSPKAKGAQGNTQWPGFRLYLECTTQIPGGASPPSCVIAPAP
jgi:hypothetical protein